MRFICLMNVVVLGLLIYKSRRGQRQPMIGGLREKAFIVGSWVLIAVLCDMGPLCRSLWRYWPVLRVLALGTIAFHVWVSALVKQMGALWECLKRM